MGRGLHLFSFPQLCRLTKVHRLLVGTPLCGDIGNVDDGDGDGGDGGGADGCEKLTFPRCLF